MRSSNSDKVGWGSSNPKSKVQHEKFRSWSVFCVCVWGGGGVALGVGLRDETLTMLGRTKTLPEMYVLNN